MSSSRNREHLAKVHQAQDFIESHLNEPFTLDAIAEAAGFSPHHFYRMFSSVTGETLYQFTLRLRLERAAGQLRQDPIQSVTAIALDSGFSSSATFARTFRNHHGLGASDWRAGGTKDFWDRLVKGRSRRPQELQNGEQGWQRTVERRSVHWAGRK